MKNITSFLFMISFVTSFSLHLIAHQAYGERFHRGDSINNTITSMAKKSCRCETLTESKKYPPDGIQNKWWGGIRKWSCDYSCSYTDSQNTRQKLTLTGHYQERYFGSDNGLWGVCEGLVYKPFYNMSLNREVFTLDSMRSTSDTAFNPLKSKSNHLKTWALNHCK